MYLLTFEVTPNVTHEDFDLVAGAFVVAWIPSSHAMNAATAEALAKQHIISSNWFIKSLEEVSLYDENNYIAEPNEQKYLDTILSGEQVYVFHTYSNSE